ncbi:MAG TPA: hypothetical protein VFV27_09565 [Nevskiaceae bacterium]|nr:hypothetical protein [Nevskiaceae bacterium]
MFFALLLVTFLVALGVSALCARMFSTPTGNILKRVIADEISSAWHRYLGFAIYVVGISSGVRLYELERYLTPPPGAPEGAEVLALTPERWVLEVYRTVVETLQGIAWMLLLFFVVALVAFVIVRIAEMRGERRPPGS